MTATVDDARWENPDDPAVMARAQREILAANSGDAVEDWRARIIDGSTWLTDGPDTPAAVWGDERVNLWASKQSLVLVGPQGAGKTAVAQRLMLGYLGHQDAVLGIPVAPGEGRALYLAGDRPEQARLSLRRMVAHGSLPLLADRLRVWQGPPPHDVARSPSLLLEMAHEAGAGLLVVDSLKDVALKLSDDEVGAAVNRAVQHCVADGIEVVLLHHPRKRGGGDTTDRPRSLDDIYGSAWLTAGAGSVLCLHRGATGIVELAQLKTPIGTEAELAFTHDHTTGDLLLTVAPDLLAILEAAGDEGTTVEHATRCLYQVADPEPKHLKATARALAALLEEGLAEKIAAPRRGVPALWRLAP